MRSVSRAASNPSISASASAAMRGRRRSMLARDEGAVHQRAEPRMNRRLARDHGEVVDLVEGPHMLGRLRPAQLLARRHMQDLAAEAAVAEQRVHRLVAGEAPHAELFPEEDRRDGADRLEGRVRSGRSAGSEASIETRRVAASMRAGPGMSRLPPQAARETASLRGALSTPATFAGADANSTRLRPARLAR